MKLLEDVSEIHGNMNDTARWETLVQEVVGEPTNEWIDHLRIPTDGLREHLDRIIHGGVE